MKHIADLIENYLASRSWMFEGDPGFDPDLIRPILEEGLKHFAAAVWDIAAINEVIEECDGDPLDHTEERRMAALARALSSPSVNAAIWDAINEEVNRLLAGEGGE